MQNSIDEELAVKIREWAEARNIIKGATQQAQFLKLAEEAGELMDSYAIKSVEGLIDAAGDVVVVLTILLAQQGDSIEGYTFSIPKPFVSLQAQLVSALGVIGAGIARGQPAKVASGAMWMLAVVLDITEPNTGIDLDYCAAEAYAEIKDRKGRMENGVFIKQSELDARANTAA